MLSVHAPVRSPAIGVAAPAGEHPTGGDATLRGRVRRENRHSDLRESVLSVTRCARFVSAAVSGDTVTITTAGLLVNGELLRNSRSLTADRDGRPLPHLALGPVVVREEEVWVLSSYSPFSFDSRYFGPVPLGQIRASVRPLWTSEREKVNSVRTITP